MRFGKSQLLRISGVALLVVVTGASVGGSQAATTKCPQNEPNVSLATFYPADATALPIYVAAQEGFFKQQCVNVTQVHVSDGNTAAQALLSGAVNMADVSALHVVPEIQQGLNLQFISGLEGENNVELLVRPNLSLPHLKQGFPGVIQDLKGAKIAITSPGSAEYYQTTYLMSQAGLKPGDYTLVYTGGNLPGDVAALQTGQIDGFVGGWPQTGQYVSAGLAKVAFSFWKGSRPADLVHLINAGIAAQTSYIQQNPAAVRGVHNAIKQAVQLVHSLNTATAARVAKAIAPDFQGFPQSEVAAMLLAYQKVYLSTITPTNIVKAEAMLALSGKPAPIPYPKVVNAVARGR